MEKKLRLGIFGGTFDPIHRGHIHLALQMKAALSLDRVLLMPAGRPPHKQERRVSPARHRYEMCRLACAGLAGFEVSDLEIRAPGPSYMADTLERASLLYPGAELELLLGPDAFFTVGHWARFSTIAALARLCVPYEGEAPPPELTRQAGRYRAEGARTALVPADLLPLSSTGIRAALRTGQGRPGAGLNTSVLTYIRSHGLYAPEQPKRPECVGNMRMEGL